MPHMYVNNKGSESSDKFLAPFRTVMGPVTVIVQTNTFVV